MNDKPNKLSSADETLMAVHRLEIPKQMSETLATLNRLEIPKQMSETLATLNRLEIPKQMSETLATLNRLEIPKQMSETLATLNRLEIPKQMSETLATLNRLEIPKQMNETFATLNRLEIPKFMSKTLASIQSLNLESIRKIEMMNDSLVRSIYEMDGRESNLYYEELNRTIEQANLREVLIEEEVLNVISDSKLKSLCYKLTMGLIIILMSSTLLEEDIEKVMTYLGFILTTIGTWKAFQPVPVQKVEHHHYHHHYHYDE
ncbi:hypothetical protein [Bacillus thuringiensis]|uniref:hypothetical protein n=1 Tax=Bacillus thuringiensis TaxID=1428 RepID=UPI0037C7D2CF